MGEALGAKMVIGGVTNGFESVIRQTLEGKGINFKTLLLDAGIGAATAGVFHGAGKLFQKASPFVKKAFSKISSKISENTRIAKIALSNIEKGPKSGVLGSNFGNVDEALGRFTKEFKKVKSGIPKTSEVEVNFNRNLKHDAVEFERQLKDQEKGLNSSTSEEYLTNRDRYLKEGRALEGNAAQRVGRENAHLEKVNELRKSGVPIEEAEKQASDWMKTQAALHNPDQIAGGNPLNIGGVGDKRINSSLGSQWKSRIAEMDEQIRGMAENMTETQRKSQHLNIKLTQ
ncbi:polymorphic toxin type 15 domain-containing protein [Clostridium estertheticum]|uniref:polymorphic toxin type 15 domain-containing protein n=1 Tax=Clostridium estertheticum TaxID=238834 RepID=UPI00209A6805|nr:polymorphic toxin type 15 domain-containing protein [Clostridium estertheticum]WAG63737.1 polymorphic toxin type 15 domain-containing protein [Clostridium estertheticum]